MSLRPTPAQGFAATVETLIVGAGACGMVAALAATEAGQEVLVLEADAVPSGSTALSAGLIPAAGTRWQAAAGIEDDPARLAADVQAKAKGENRPEIVAALTETVPRVLEWLADRHGLAFSVVTDFDYPGHSRRRMHGLASRSGAELVDRLRAACERVGVEIVCSARVTALFAEADGRVTGVEVTRPDGGTEALGCGRLVLACNGFGGNAAMVAAEIPEAAEAIYFGHAGNRGEAVAWGRALGAGLRHMGAWQGHGNVAHPHGILISWAVIAAGGYQVNAEGARFWDESQGYSEAARHVLAEPGGWAVAVFDERIAAIARQFADFRTAEAQGAVRRADDLEALAGAFGLPAGALTRTAAEVATAEGRDRFGRDWAGVPPLAPPYCGVRVTGALFHTQGGLDITPEGRVRRAAGGVLPNLWAAGGAACGVSGAADAGYLSGNGLLAAVAMGWRAGAGGVQGGGAAPGAEGAAPAG